MQDQSGILIRATTVRIELPDGSEVTIPSPSLGQASQALRLDPKPGAGPESDKQRILRLHAQAQVLLGKEFSYLTGILTIAQASELISALYLAANGVDPTDLPALQKYLARQRENRATSQEILECIDKLTLELAADLKLTPAQAAEMPVADAVSLHAKLAAKRQENAKWEASLHDKKLA